MGMAPAFVYRALAIFVHLLPVSLRAKVWNYLAVLGNRRWERESCSQRISGGMYVKRSTVHRLSEGHAIQFVGSRTSLPVPIVVDNFQHEGITYLVTSRLQGHPLMYRWVNMPPEAETKLSAQLSQLLAPLRAIPAPSDAVCAFGGGPVYCARIRFDTVSPAGPWQDVVKFHAELMLRTGGLTEYVPEGQSEVIHDVVRRAHAGSHRVCLTHNDLGPHNILVDDEWNITGIVDWEACGWMPEYWCVPRSLRDSDFAPRMTHSESCRPRLRSIRDPE